MRKKLLFLLGITLISIGLSGCNGLFENETVSTTKESTSNTATTYDNTTQKSKIEETTTEITTTQETTIEQTTSETTEKVTYNGDITALSNEPINWGVGTQLTDDNRPAGPVTYQEKFKNYEVDFIKENESVLYLTFDEGYENGYTGDILNTLKEKNVKAVFFVTLSYAQNNPELIKRMIDEGHVVGAHSVSHPSTGMPSLSIEEQKNEFKELHQYIKDNYDYEMYLFRPPVGIFSEQSLAVAQSMGYRTVLWSFAYADWDPENQPTEADGLEKTIGRLHNGGIYLLHAVSLTNKNILGKFIDGAEKKGYIFKEYVK